MRRRADGLEGVTPAGPIHKALLRGSQHRIRLREASSMTEEEHQITWSHREGVAQLLFDLRPDGGHAVPGARLQVFVDGEKIVCGLPKLDPQQGDTELPKPASIKSFLSS